VGQAVLGAHLAGARPDDERDLALEGQQLAAARTRHRVAVAGQRRRRLEEVGGDVGRAAALGGATGVVEVHRDDLRRPNTRHGAHHTARTSDFVSNRSQGRIGSPMHGTVFPAPTVASAFAGLARLQCRWLDISSTKRYMIAVVMGRLPRRPDGQRGSGGRCSMIQAPLRSGSAC
jgi:hypothetical protein